MPRFLWLPRKLLTLGAALLATACASPEHTAPPDFSPSPSVSRQQVLAIASAYHLHRWKPTESNVFHGTDSQGIRINTPDVAYTDPAAIRPGWWIPGEENIGIPYMWGGFDTPESFDQKISNGYYAGDIYSEEKRRLMDSAVSNRACGVDCSGFLSRCWRLSRPYSTIELPTLCDALPSYDQLQPGDVINKPNVHALLFVKFTDTEKQRFLAYETGSPPTWKVLLHEISVSYVQNLGYLPYRYRNIRE